MPTHVLAPGGYSHRALLSLSRFIICFNEDAGRISKGKTSVPLIEPLSISQSFWQTGYSAVTMLKQNDDD